MFTTPLIYLGRLPEAEALVTDQLKAAESAFDANALRSQRLYEQLQTSSDGTRALVDPSDFHAGSRMDFVVTRGPAGYGFTIEGGHGLRIAPTIAKVQFHCR